jgi:hypothetical protein
MITRNRIIGAVVVLVVLVGGGILISTAGGDEDAAPTTTAPSTTTTTAPSTTTTPPPPPPVWPLTGLPVDDVAAMARPALAVKIDNHESARPQVGLNQADVVWEERVEAGITRFFAVFHSQDSQPIGPVRSGRSTEIAILSALGRPMFAWSGSNDFMAADIRASNIVDVAHTPAVDQYFRDSSRRAPHNLFINGYLPMVDSHRADAGTPPVTFSFRPPDAVPLGDPAVHVDLDFGGGSGGVPISFDWTGLGWARTQNGTAHVDAAGVQVAPPNLVVQFIEYVGYIHGAHLPVGQLVGEGEVWVFSEGRRIVGRWSKPTPESVTQYVLPDGSPILLTPGRTWVALVPPGGAVAT